MKHPGLSFCYYASRDWGLYGHDRMQNARSHSMRADKLQALLKKRDRHTAHQYQMRMSSMARSERHWMEENPEVAAMRNMRTAMYGWPW